MTTLIRRELACPLCGTGFTASQIGSTNTHGPLTSDLRRHATGTDPLVLDVHACPRCGWTAGEGPWGEHPDLADREVEPGVRLADHVARELGPAPAAGDVALRYEAAARCAAWAGLGPLREGDCWLRAAWMHADAGRTDPDRTCRERALQAYRRAVEEQKWFQRRQDLVVICYLVGELSRRLGDAAEARRWYEQAIRWTQGRPELQDLVAVVRRQVDDPVEFIEGR